jgi:dTDP-4-amino-4,6-dideoxygalactose transaminase
MTDIHAALGISQLKQVLKWTQIRQDNASYLSSKIINVEVPVVPVGFNHVYHQYTIRIRNNRDLFAQKLTELGVGNSVYYPTQVHKLPSFNQNLRLVNTQEATEQVLSLPVHPSLSKKDLNKVANSVNRVGEEFL